MEPSNGAVPAASSPFPEPRIATPSTAATKQTKICVYCGSSAGTRPEHIEAARALARAMAANNIALGESYPSPPLHFFPPPTKTSQKLTTPPIQSTEEAQSA